MAGWFRMAAAAVGRAGRRRHRVRAVAVSLESRAHFRALSRRRRRRYPGAHAGRCGVPAMGPIGRDRKPAGRRRRDRLASAGDLAARRLHPDRGRERSCHQSVPLFESCPTTPSRTSRRSRCLPSSPNILLVRADSPFKTVGDMIAQAKAKPGSLSFGHAGTGTSTHLAGELLKNLAKIDISPISYKGGAPAINDLLGGQIPMSFNNGPELVGQFRPARCARWP